MTVKTVIVAAAIVLVIILVPMRMSGICSRDEERRGEDG